MRKSESLIVPGMPSKSPKHSLFISPSEFLVRVFSKDDLNAILEIQNACPGIAAWRAREYEQLAADPRGMLLVAVCEDRMLPEIVGFSALYRVDGEAELWNIAVAPAHRRRGIARALLHEAFGRLADLGARRVFLEVRESNLVAVELYLSLGFVPLSRRRDYYQHPKEDALVLVRNLAKTAV